MATNSMLTPTMITREALRVLHSKLSFLGNVNKQYDNRFAQSGAKIGTSLAVRMPPKYTARKTSTFAAQEYVDRSVALPCASQYGVDVSFTSVELTMQLDDFSKRVIDPAMSQLAAVLEGDALVIAKNATPNFTGTTSTQLTYKQFAQSSQLLSQNLAPQSGRIHLLNPLSRVEFSDAVKGLFHDSTNVKELYKEGIMGRTGGFDVYENTLLPTHTVSGSAVTNGTPLVTGTPGTTVTTNAWVATTSVDTDGWTSACGITKGDIVTIDGVYDVHPESKVSTGVLKRFVITNETTTVVTAGTITLTLSPGIMSGVGNAFQNVSGAVTNNAPITRIGVVNTSYGQNLAFHEDAFIFASADLEDVSRYGAWGSRQTMDGISMRLAQQYSISADSVATRFDVLWGFTAAYPELAVRGWHSLT
jgi:hypothetical protein